jgi:hypothetical protein
MTNKQPNIDSLSTYEDFEALRLSNPGFYFSGKVQNRLHQKAFELGDKFWQAKSGQLRNHDGTFAPLSPQPVDREVRIAELKQELSQLEATSLRYEGGSTNDQ